MTPSGDSARERSFRTTTFALGAVLTLLVVVTTVLDIPSSDLRAAGYTAIGFVISLIAAYSTGVTQGRLNDTQEEIRKVLMDRVNSRQERTQAVIEICEQAQEEFRAVTYFPAVGIQDDPDNAPRKYLNALENLLEDEVKVTLVSVTCAEARIFGAEREFSNASLKALDYVEERLESLLRHYSDDLTIITLPGSAMTLNVCHNHETALIYFMSPIDDRGMGFRSSDSLIKQVAKGGATRYASYGERERRYPLPRS
jgi:hypothetical protein